jgi:hypothetical protein
MSDHISGGEDTENVGGSPLSGDQRSWPKNGPQPLQPLAGGQHVEQRRIVAKQMTKPPGRGE